MNQETEGTDEEPLTADHAARMQQFIQYFKSRHRTWTWSTRFPTVGTAKWLAEGLTEENLGLSCV